jgi:hypothetical protein
MLNLIQLKETRVVSANFILTIESGVLTHENICSLYFKMHVIHILKFQKIQNEKFARTSSVLHAHKVVLWKIDLLRGVRKKRQKSMLKQGFLEDKIFFFYRKQKNYWLLIYWRFVHVNFFCQNCLLFQM